jgi:hypothetical protein
MSEIVEYSLTRQHEEQQEGKPQGLSRLDRIKAPVYNVMAEVNQLESPYEDAAAIKAGEALMITAERGVKKMKEKFGRNRMQEPPRRMKDAAKPLQKDDFALTTS